MANFLQLTLVIMYLRPPLVWMYRGVFCGMITNRLWHRFGQRCWWRPCCGILLGIWAWAVLWATVLSRQPGSGSQVQWLPLATYWSVLTGGDSELLRSAFMNMLLFFPGGLLCAGLAGCKPRSVRPVIVSFLLFGLFSLGIELTQGFLQLGMAETDDVLHNVLGAAAGFVIFQIDTNS